MKYNRNNEIQRRGKCKRTHNPSISPIDYSIVDRKCYCWACTTLPYQDGSFQDDFFINGFPKMYPPHLWSVSEVHTRFRYHTLDYLLLERLITNQLLPCLQYPLDPPTRGSFKLEGSPFLSFKHHEGELRTRIHLLPPLPWRGTTWRRSIWLSPSHFGMIQEAHFYPLFYLSLLSMKHVVHNKRYVDHSPSFLHISFIEIFWG